MLSRNRFIYQLLTYRVRDTTVQSLTVQPTVKDGTIVYEDSPLVRAVRLGHALVVDEADKAPTHVTCVLKNLLESGRATLADGRKIVSGNGNCFVMRMRPFGFVDVSHLTSQYIAVWKC